MTGATIRLRADDRWPGTGLSPRRLSTTMILIALGSLAGHMAILAGAALDAKPPPPPQQEISVEIVRDVPKTAPAPKADAAKPQPQPQPQPPRIDAAKSDAKPEPKSEPPKPEPAPVKAEQPQQQAAPKAPPPPPSAAEDAAKAQKLATLEQELQSLKAEQTQLQSERAAETAAAQQQPAPVRDAGLGPLPDSFQAVALPASADGQGEATSYQEIVFSALAKAKGIGETRGLPGTAGVHFSIDAAGQLIDVELVHKSGVGALDAEALDIVRRAAPFPTPPQGARRAFDANFTFKTQAAP